MTEPRPRGSRARPTPTQASRCSRLELEVVVGAGRKICRVVVCSTVWVLEHRRRFRRVSTVVVPAAPGRSRPPQWPTELRRRQRDRQQAQRELQRLPHDGREYASSITHVGDRRLVGAARAATAQQAKRQASFPQDRVSTAGRAAGRCEANGNNTRREPGRVEGSSPQSYRRGRLSHETRSGLSPGRRRRRHAVLIAFGIPW